MKEMLNSYEGKFYTRLSDLTAELEADGYEVLEATAEVIVVGYEDDGEDVQAELRLTGTESTIAVRMTREIYRA